MQLEDNVLVVEIRHNRELETRLDIVREERDDLAETLEARTRFIRNLAEDATSELERRRRGPLGVQVGAFYMGGWSMGSLIMIKREANQALETK